MSKSRSTPWFIALLAVLTLGAGGAYYYTQVYQPAQAPVEPALQTARVRTGDLTITADGAGNLVPASELDLGFRTAGVLVEVTAGVGEAVSAGQVLARLDDSAAQLQLKQAELNLAAAQQSLAKLTSAGALADAQLAVINRQAALADAQAALKALLNPDVAYYQDLLADAQRDYDSAVATAQLVTTGSRSPEQAVANAEAALTTAQGKLADAITWWGADSDKALAAQVVVDLAQADLTAAQIALQVALANQEKSVTNAEAALTAAQASYTYVTHYQAPSSDVALTEAQAQAAAADLAEAEALVAELKGEPLPAGAFSTLAAARTQVAQAELSVASAQLALANTVLTAPSAGTLTAVKAEAGEAVTTAPLFTLAALEAPVVRFYVEESDLGKVAAGYAVNVTFDAAPDVPVPGTVTRVDPALVTVDGSPAVQAWAVLDAPAGVLSLVSGLSGDVEIVAGQAKNALLVPVQALRELAPGSYAVFVVQADGTLKLTPVTVGLKDFANAEITSGLKAGDVVSTGTIETK